MKVEEKVLYCRDDSLNMDKEYRACLLREADRYVLYFAWGRRGTTLQKGVSRSFSTERVARAWMAVQLDKKRRKGYRSTEETARKMTADIKTKQRAQLAEAERQRLARVKPRREVRRYPTKIRPRPKPQAPPPLFGGVRRIKLKD